MIYYSKSLEFSLTEKVSSLTSDKGSSNEPNKPLRILVYALALVWGAMQAWNYRFELFFGDSQAYLDMAWYYSQGEFAKAVSLYWSPLYPMIAGCVFKLFPPHPYWLTFELKVVNFLCFIGVLISYEFFFKQLYEYYLQKIVPLYKEHAVLDRNLLLFTGYALVLLFALAFGGVYQDTPDMLNAAIFFVAIGLLLKLIVSPRMLTATLLGASIGLAYWCKAIMLPLSVVFIALQFLFQRNYKLLAITVATLVIVSAPWIYTMSSKVGRFSIGESARFIYINLVEERDPMGAEGLIHPPRFLNKMPQVREFGTAVPGTVPFLYDLGYWSAGAKMNFRITDILRTIGYDLIYYLHTFLYIPIIVTGCVWFKTRKFPLPIKAMWMSAPVWAPPAALCAQYCLCNNMYLIPYIDRYFVATYPLLMFGVLIALRVPLATQAMLKQACLITIAICIFFCANRVRFDASDLSVEKRHEWYMIAMALREAGVKPGDPIAQLGNRIHRNTQYTEPDRLRQVSTILHEEVFWASPPEERQRIIELIRGTGARVLTYVRIPDREDPLVTKDLELFAKLTGLKIKMPFKEYAKPTDLTGWTTVPGVDAYYYILDPTLKN